jgi:hypothetical protein
VVQILLRLIKKTGKVSGKKFMWDLAAMMLKAYNTTWFAVTLVNLNEQLAAKSHNNRASTHSCQEDKIIKVGGSKNEKLF